MNEPENEAATATYELTPQMAPEAEATARARLAEMSDEQKHRLICLPVLGWENERLLLQNEAPHSWRILGEVLATSRVAEMDRIKRALQNLRDEWSKDGAFQHGGKVAAALDEVFAEFDTDKSHIRALEADLEKENKMWSRDELAARFEVTPNQITNYRRQAREAKVLASKRGPITSQEFPLFRDFINSKTKRKRAKHSKTQ